MGTCVKSHPRPVKKFPELFHFLLIKESQVNHTILILGPFLTPEQLEESKKFVNIEEKIKESKGYCGNEHIPRIFPRERQMKNFTSKLDPPCGSTYTCDYSSVRDTYTTNPNNIFRVIWMVFNCSSTGNWNIIAPSKIAEAHSLLNNIYLGVGYQFTYEIRYYPCTGTQGTNNYASFDQNNVITAVSSEIGTNFQQLGKLIVVSGAPTDSLLNGFFFLPGGSYSGVGFMNTLRVGTGYTTLPHELGHAYGLLHTFAGVSETNNCQCPEVTPDDNTGDFCSDTPPVARNWECVAQISTTTYPDPCTPRGPYWTNNPFTNLMSYGDCRIAFTGQQQRRVRCYGTNSLTWLKDDRCYGIASNDPTVCNGNGICVTTDTCQCYSGWSGPQCTIQAITCYGLQPTDPTVCNGKGTCTAQDTCTCQSGWSGSQCTQFNCFGILPTDPTVCNGKGTCTGANTCTCQSGWSGSQCTTYSCFGILPTNPTVCSGKGTCIGLDTCNCQAGYSGNQCQSNALYNCYGIQSNDTTVCSGKGSCTGNNQCTCFNQYSGLQCQYSTCFGKNSTDPTVCSGQGTCNGGTCTCNNGFTGSQCESKVNICYGLNNTNPNVCSGNGNCTDYNTCICSSGYVGNQCQYSKVTNSSFTCYGIPANSSLVCSGNGSCVNNNLCGCYTGFGGEICNHTVCFGNYSNNACNGRGICISFNVCLCGTSVYGLECDILECNGQNYTNIDNCDQLNQSPPPADKWYYSLIAAGVLIPCCCIIVGILGVLTYLIVKRIISKNLKENTVELKSSLIENDSLNSTYVQPEEFKPKVQPNVKFNPKVDINNKLNAKIEKLNPKDFYTKVEPNVKFNPKSDITKNLNSKIEKEPFIPIVPMKKEPKPLPKKKDVYVAIFEFVGQEQDELSIKIGDKITLINKDESGWWKGQLNGKIGLFPGNYVELQK